ncbi:MAG TPA: BTAD domain-containing putative transcriptional regulator, partial [Burkholderiales bacterium]|nr:BTAD domain-containing putative transcriptional regulator [Burkholderiales bacterium]
ALLDEAREHKPAICVVGPPGAGKTTLVASWFDARGIKGIWYQVDAGDADLATFFYYLGEAAKPYTRRGQRPLPLLTPEYLADVAGFSRRYFRELFSRLPAGATLVLDNYQEIPAEQPFHELISGATAEVPLAITLICVSRRDPPECYARLMANDRVVLIDWGELKLTLEEACAIGQQRQQLSREEVAQLHERCDGWAAGLVLLLERVKRSRGFEATSTDSLREVFNYFAAQLVEQFDTSAQKALTQMSYLPRMSAPMAIAITGTPSAAALLEELHRRHLFTDRRAAQEPVYQFHALFQAYLQHRAQQTLTPQEQMQAALHAARLLEEGGHPEEAFPLALKAGDPDGASAIALRNAATLIGQGRWRVVVDWTEALPTDLVASNCWLLHWHGTALIAVNPPEARVLLETSFEAAEAAGDALCQVQAAAGVIQTYMLEYAQFRPLDRWIEVLRAKLKTIGSFSSADAELRAQSALLIALAYRKPDDPALDPCAERVFDLLNSDANANLRLLSAAYLVAWGASTGPVSVATRALPQLKGLLSLPEITALSAAWAWFIISFYYSLAELDESAEAIAQVERIGTENGLNSVYRWAAIIGFWNAIRVYDFETAEKCIRRLEKVVNPAHLYDVASVHWDKAWLATLKGEPLEGLKHGTAAARIHDQSGSLMHRTNVRSCCQWAYIQLGDFENARKWIEDQRRLASRLRSRYQEVRLRLTEAYLALEEGHRSLAVERIRSAATLARETGCDYGFDAWLPRWKFQLAAIALSEGIDEEFLRHVIRRFRWPAPSLLIEQWPWPVRVYTLGRFQLVIDDKLLAFSHKTPKKPIALLKAIVSLGGRDVRTDALVDALWTELEGDAGEEAFNQALHRLRRLLGSGEAVLLEDGKASLNEALVWTDVRAFEELLGQEQPNGDHEALFKLYRGQFLAEEPEAGWAVSMRERLRGKFIHKVEQAGVQLESAGRWYDAIALYLRGLDADSLNEAFYQGLMRCYAGLGNRAEALSVYRRLRDQLSIVLGMKPSSSSETLARELRLQ